MPEYPQKDSFLLAFSFDSDGYMYSVSWSGFWTDLLWELLPFKPPALTQYTHNTHTNILNSTL